MGRRTNAVDLYNGRVTTLGNFTFFSNPTGSLTLTVTLVGVTGGGMVEYIDLYSQANVGGSTLLRVIADDVVLVSATYSLSGAGTPAYWSAIWGQFSNTAPEQTLEPVPFKNSFSVVVSNPAASSASTVGATLCYRLITP